MKTLKEMQALNPNLVVYKKADGRFAGVPKSLIERQKVTKDNVKRIIELQKRRGEIEDMMLEEDDLDELVIEWHENEFKLQDLWGFERDRNYHKFWNIPSCQCPKMDNDDVYPTGYYVISAACKLHGKGL